MASTVPIEKPEIVIVGIRGVSDGYNSYNSGWRYTKLSLSLSLSLSIECPSLCFVFFVPLFLSFLF